MAMKGAIMQRWRCSKGHVIDAPQKPTRCAYGKRAQTVCGAQLALLSDGIFYLRVELPRDAKGVRRQRRETVRGTKPEAERRLRDLLRDVENGGLGDVARITVAEVC